MRIHEYMEYLYSVPRISVHMYETIDLPERTMPGTILNAEWNFEMKELMFNRANFRARHGTECYKIIIITTWRFLSQ